jgi:glycine dehydrogenase
MYVVYHGPEGLTAIANGVRRRTAVLAAGLRQLGFTLRHDNFFDTLTVETGAQTQAIVARAQALKLNFRIGHTSLGISTDETTTPALIELVWQAFSGQSLAYSTITAEPVIPAGLERATPFLTHPVFHRYRSETEMLRYLRKLCDRDLALDRAMIPLGSCTMKLNATTEMIPVTWPEFGALHPFAPAEQAAGYKEMCDTLEADLREVTGYDAISLQPNSGAQGEYAGLLAIRGYHVSRGDAHRTVCLIPDSAHGTNPASAVMAGMTVVPVKTTAEGTIDLADLTAKAEQHADRLAALMVTYPSTFGVFEISFFRLRNCH